MRKAKQVEQENPTHWVERRTYPDEMTMVIERPETLVVGFSSLVTGVSVNNVPWKRWKRGLRITFSVRRSRAGRRALHIYVFDRRAGTLQNRTAVIASLIPEPLHEQVAGALSRLWERNVGAVPELLSGSSMSALAVGLAFPALAGRPLPTPKPFTESPVAPAGLTHAWRQATARGVAEQLFGKRALRRDLIRACATVDPHRAAIAHAVRGLVPVDHLVEYMQQPDGTVDRWDRNTLRQLFTAIAPASRRRLLLQTQVRDEPRPQWNLSDDSLTIFDALRCVRELTEVHASADAWMTDDVRKPKSWRELHDHLSRLLRRAETPQRSIPPTAHAAALDGLVTPAGRLRAAKQTSDLFDWAEAMDNCIAGYASEAVGGDTTLFGLYRDGALIANMEVGPEGRIEQLFGRFNEHLPAADEQAVTDAVETALAERRQLVAGGVR
ncbi:PcfJ domain-containing protein [Curtobacterium citreum]